MIAIISNIFLPVHFIALLLIGTIYSTFSQAIERECYSSLTLMIVAFCFIELAQGLKLFSLSLLAFFIYISIYPILQKALSSQKLINFIMIFVFYFGTLLLFNFLGELNYEFKTILLINYFIDMIILGILL
jgi:hypothetical protein